MPGTIIGIMLLGVLAAGGFIAEGGFNDFNPLANNRVQVVDVAIPSPFVYSFNTDEALSEAGRMDESTSPYWWVNSGGYLSIASGYGGTNQGSLPAGDKWRMTYAVSNPLDTDNGYHPQNIFRLVSRGVWHDYTEESYFMISADELSDSPNRNESNGLLLFLRYASSGTLYYAGLRVDGTAVIKKKINGKYYTLKQTPIFSGKAYDRMTNPNLLPKHKWIGLRADISNGTNGTVDITLYTDIGMTGRWTPVLTATDDGVSFGGPAILNAGYAGIRTDFMDVLFKDFKITEKD